MNLRGFQVKTALVIFFLIIGFGLGIRYFYLQNRVLTPLNLRLEQLPGVSGVELSRGKGPEQAGILVRLALNDEVALGVTLEQVRRVLGDSAGVYTVELIDTADPGLLGLFAKIRLAAEEAVMTGEFSLLEERVRNLAESENSVWELSLDRQYIYLRLAKGGHTLHRAIARGAAEGRILILETGGVAGSG
ncbi:MAG TPA: hypothetical protein GX521_05795 [Firmicutes bacterium]|nr:hypothetical protein [Bacillota bacterium]